jgi:hypothetical protein
LPREISLEKMRVLKGLLVSFILVPSTKKPGVMIATHIKFKSGLEQTKTEINDGNKK